MAYSKISQQDKQRLFNAFRGGDDYLNLASQLAIKDTTARNIIKRIQSRDGVITLPKGGKRVTKVDNEIKRCCEDILSETSAITIKALNVELGGDCLIRFILQTVQWLTC